MNAFVKPLIDFITWRWAPAVGLLTASLLYVMIVVGLVPSEIGVPVANSKFEPRSTSAPTSLFGGSPTTAATSERAYTTETKPVSTPPRPVMRAPVADFGRRGFSPRLERPEPPTPSPPTTVTAAVPRSGIGGIFSRLHGALRPGSPGAQSLSEARQAQSASAPPVPPPPPPPAPAAAEPVGPDPVQPPPDAQQPPAPADSGAAAAPSADAPEAPAQ